MTYSKGLCHKTCSALRIHEHRPGCWGFWISKPPLKSKGHFANTCGTKYISQHLVKYVTLYSVFTANVDKDLPFSNTKAWGPQKTIIQSYWTPVSWTKSLTYLHGKTFIRRHLGLGSMCLFGCCTDSWMLHLMERILPAWLYWNTSHPWIPHHRWF